MLRGGIMGENLNEWIRRMLQQKGWSMRELGRRSGLSHPYISNVLAGKQEPGIKFYQGMSKAFDLTLSQVERLDREGVAPNDLESLDDTLTLKEAWEAMNRLSSEEQKEVLRYMNYLISLEKSGSLPDDEGDEGDEISAKE